MNKHEFIPEVIQPLGKLKIDDARGKFLKPFLIIHLCFNF